MMWSYVPLILIAAASMVTIMTGVWFLHRPLRNAGIVDIAWAAGLVVIAWIYLVFGDGYWLRQWMLTGLVTWWGGRLAWLLYNRVLNHDEDGRYGELRREWGSKADVRFFWFFQMQAGLNVILSIPFLAVALNTNKTIGIPEWLGMVIGTIAVIGESTADRQLRRFKANPSNRGKVCQVGLWNYSRHPNYFFEWLVWVGFFVFALSSPFGWHSVLCPILMLYFLYRVTGIPATEQQAIRTKGDAYRNYQETTSPFIPWRKWREAA